MTKKTTNEDKEQPNNIISMQERLEIAHEEDSADEGVDEVELEELALEMGKASLEDSLAKAKGFVAILVDDKEEVDIVHAGTLDVLKMLGALEYTKDRFLHDATNIPKDFYEGDEGSD